MSRKLIATDSTPVKARASRASEYLAEVEDESVVYWERLDAYEEIAQEELERKTGRRRKKKVQQLSRNRR